MQLVLITHPASPSPPSEPATLRALFDDHGLQTLHLRKPGASADELSLLLDDLSPAHRRRVVLHSHHHLARQFSLKGVHYRCGATAAVVGRLAEFALALLVWRLEEMELLHCPGAPRGADLEGGGIIKALPGLTASASYHATEQLGTCIGKLCLANRCGACQRCREPTDKCAARCRSTRLLFPLSHLRQHQQGGLCVCIF